MKETKEGFYFKENRFLCDLWHSISDSPSKTETLLLFLKILKLSDVMHQAEKGLVLEEEKTIFEIENGDERCSPRLDCI